MISQKPHVLWIAATDTVYDGNTPQECIDKMIAERICFSVGRNGYAWCPVLLRWYQVCRHGSVAA